MRSMEKRHSPYGGTLLEVLVSLLILVLIASSLLEITARKRHALEQEMVSQQASRLALQWKLGRAANDFWAQGNAGSFPDHESAQWSLTPADAVSDSEGLMPDPSWMRLAVTPDGTAPLAYRSFFLWLGQSAPASQSAGPETAP